MTLLYFLLCCLPLLCGVLYLHIRNLTKRSIRAAEEFKEFSNPGRHSPEAELEEFAKKYSSTASAVLTFQKYLGAIIPALEEPAEFFRTFRQQHSENNRLHAAIIAAEEWAEDFEATLRGYFSERYFACSEKENLLHSNADQIDEFHRLYPRFREYFTRPAVEFVFDTLRHFERLRTDHNRRFVENELEQKKEFFNTVLQHPLDPQQRDAIVKEEDNTLIISGAGSGKTTTIVGKLRYLLEQRNVNPENILALSYTRAAANQLLARLENPNVYCATFHKLALDILTAVDGRRPSICEESLLLTLFQELIGNNEEYKKHVYNYITRYQSRIKPSHQYQTLNDFVVSQKKYGVQSPFPDARGRSVYTKSEEEKRLCVLLTELGIEFLYEEPYPFAATDPESTNFKQYEPDFTLIVPTGERNPITDLPIYRRVYLEHFAIDAHGDVPAWFADNDPGHSWANQNRRYHDGIAWKRRTHQRNHTTLIETTSADFASRRIREVLIQRLQAANVPIVERTPEECYELIMTLDRTEMAVYKLLEQFINIAKSNGISIDNVVNQASARGDGRTRYIILNLVKPLFESYQLELSRRNQIDFIDAINRAADYCNSGRYTPQFTHILVDEFQDISMDRFQLLQSLRCKEPLTKLFCVGDDWQSIYRFGGSDINIFNRFQDYVGATEVCHISTTYRLRNPMLSLSSEFIMRNPNQSQREIIPHNPEPPTEIHAIDCGPQRLRNMAAEFIDLLQHIPADEDVLIIGRNNQDIRSICPQASQNGTTVTVQTPRGRIPYLTVHRSKGLEADNIILINCNSGINGFPSLIEDDPILSYVLSEDDPFEYAEERRLFYVALTRARKRTYILHYSDIPSPFLKEIDPELGHRGRPCPLCHDGSLVTISEWTTRDGIHHSTTGCTNNQAGCPYYSRN